MYGKPVFIDKFCLMPIHIGKIIESVAREKNMGATRLGKLMNTSRENIYDIYRRETIDTAKLQQLTEILEHDFFQHFYEEEPLKKYRDSKIALLEERINELERDVETQSEFAKVYKELSHNQRKRLIYMEEEKAKYWKDTGTDADEMSDKATDTP